jgi:hypothetical protein
VKFKRNADKASPGFCTKLLNSLKTLKISEEHEKINIKFVAVNKCSYIKYSYSEYSGK